MKKKEPKRKRVIFVVDDEFEHYAFFYECLEECLGKKYKIIALDDVDNFLAVLEEFSETITIQGFILDVTLDPGKTFGQDPRAEVGLRTGVLLQEKLRKMGFSQKIAFLTYISDTKLIQKLNRKKNVKHFSNCELFPHEFGPEAAKYLLS